MRTRHFEVFLFQNCSGRKKLSIFICQEQSSFVTLLDNIATQHQRQHRTATARSTVHYITCNAHISTLMPMKCNDIIQTWPQYISCSTYLWIQQKSDTKQQCSESVSFSIREQQVPDEQGIRVFIAAGETALQ